ncbi:hypothetical protein CEXT_191171 [Caerostris extrusa]|uniref:H/ACA ribonucleoprotein complex subunit n=1 Tax=Caerostris extrusa TaxID=172846 RepID=A0AAV4QBC5_CAEEX|nr:hypothetical protein CEXT_191171 [Caerostris extrusa]
MVRSHKLGMSRGFGGRGGRGGFGGGRGRGGGFGGRGGRGGGRGGFRNFDTGPPEEVRELGYFSHPCEEQLVCKVTIEDVPFFNAPIYLENKEQIGKVDEIFGPIRDYYISVKLSEDVKANSFEKIKRFILIHRKYYLYNDSFQNLLALLQHLEEVVEEDEEDVVEEVFVEVVDLEAAVVVVEEVDLEEDVEDSTEIVEAVVGASTETAVVVVVVSTETAVVAVVDSIEIVAAAVVDLMAEDSNAALMVETVMAIKIRDKNLINFYSYVKQRICTS